MNTRTMRIYAVTAVSLIAISGCGGGGGGDSGGGSDAPAAPVAPSAQGQQPLNQPIKGTVAVGAPVNNARIELFDPVTSAVSTATSVDGTFQIESENFNFPALLRASGGTVNGQPNNEVFHIILLSRPTVANLTPLTEMHSARLLRQLAGPLFGNASAAQAALNGLDSSDSAKAADDVAAILEEEGVLADGAQVPDFLFDQIVPRPGDANDDLLTRFKAAGTTTVDLATELATTGDTIPAASSGILAIESSLVSGTSYAGDVKVTLTVNDRKGVAYKGLTNDRFVLKPFSVSCDSGTSQTATGSFSPASVIENAGGTRQNYSAMVLLDQSGSIDNTDPQNARIDGSKALFAAATAGDEIGLGYFSGEGNADRYASFTPLFGQSVAELNANLDFLATRAGGGTPLYTSVIAATNDVAANATTPNRALVVFSDGDANNETRTADDAIQNAKARNVKLYSVVLNSGGTSIRKLDEFVRLGVETQGAMFEASDVRRSLGAYKSLSAFLDGTASTYTVTTQISGSNPCGPSTITLQNALTVSTKAGELSVPMVLDFQ